MDRYIVTQRSDGKTAIDLAHAHGHQAVVELLLTNCRDKDLAYTQEQYQKLLTTSSGVDIPEQDGQNNNTLQLALGREDNQGMQLLLNKEADVGTQGEIHSSSIQGSSEEGQDLIMQ